MTQTDPFAIIAGVELRDVEETPLLDTPSGYQWMIGHQIALGLRKERHDALLKVFGCKCWRCMVDAADMLAGRRTVKPSG